MKSEQKRFFCSVAAVEHTALEQHYHVPAFIPLSKRGIVKAAKNQLLKQIVILFLQKKM